jgi:hypothetical protein
MSNIISSTFDGSIYQNAIRNLNEDKLLISLNLNTDGVFLVEKNFPIFLSWEFGSMKKN